MASGLNYLEYRQWPCGRPHGAEFEVDSVPSNPHQPAEVPADNTGHLRWPATLQAASDLHTHLRADWLTSQGRPAHPGVFPDWRTIDGGQKAGNCPRHGVVTQSRG